MHRKFIALILAAALAVVGLSARPARADSEEAARVLAGLAALAFIGAIIRDSQNDVPVASQGRPNYPAPPRHGQPAPRPLPPKVSRLDLPAKCLVQGTGRHGTGRILGAQCLEKNYRHMGTLPRGCRVQRWDGWRMRTGYAPACLKQRGYRLTRR